MGWRAFPLTVRLMTRVSDWLLQRDRIALGAGLLGITALCWLWIVPMARDMYGAMTGPSAWMMRATWDAEYMLLLWAMWSVMMAGMMLPSAFPLLLFYDGLLRRAPSAPRPGPHVAAMTAGYLAVWALFSIAATLLQRVLTGWLLLTPMMETASPRAGGILLLTTGAYQWTPLKGACLRACRSPLSFLMQRWRRGLAGAFRMGFGHGIYCLGCCWALMLILFAGGVMNLGVIVTLTIWVLVEKTAPFAEYTSIASGAALLGMAVWMLAR